MGMPVLIYIDKNPKLLANGFYKWVISSVWLECYVDIVEVTGSTPVSPTINLIG